MSSLLTLTASAFLANLDNRNIILHFEGLHYSSGEAVPHHITRANLQRMHQTAGEYVRNYMTERHGERTNWPQIAQQFVLDRRSDGASQSREIKP